MVRLARDPRAIVVLACAAFGALGIGWGLPYSDSWAADAISPRACGLGAIAETYLPGHHHVYPPLHMLLLTLLSLPEIALAIAHVGTGTDALEHALVQNGPMTAIELTARLVSVAMFAGTAWCTTRLWERLAGRRAGIAAGAVVATNATLVYYAHTGNLDVPYLFWSALAFLELDRAMAGERRETRAVLAMTAAVLTKDQAAGFFLLVAPFAVLTAWRAPVQRARWIKALAWGAVTYLVLSGALVNPRGFVARVHMLLGPASADWAAYPATTAGRVAIARDVLLSVPRYTSWLIAAAAAIGLVIALRGRIAPRARALLPFAGAASYTLFFTLGARRTEDRFVLAQSVLFFPYAALAFEAWARRAPPRAALVVVALIAFVPAGLAVASLDATLFADARYAAERFLAQLPAGTRVEVYGGPRFLPRLPPDLVASRVGMDEPSERSHIPGIAEIHAEPADVRERAPDYVVLSTEFSHPEAAVPGRARFGVASYARSEDAAFFGALQSGALGYERVFDATCALPWPLACRPIHGSTGEPVWIYRRR